MVRRIRFVEWELPLRSRLFGTGVAGMLLMAATACSEPAARDADWPGSVDTLANGALHVSNPEEPLWSEGEGWALVEEVRIGSADAEGPELFAQIRALEMDDQGRMYVLEGQANELRIFDPSGVHLRTVGGAGEGPGEFGNPAGMGWHASGELWVVDLGNARFAAFDQAGEFLGSHRRPLVGYVIPWPGAFGPDGEVYEQGFGAPGAASLIRFAPGMSEADTFPLPSQDESERFVFESDGGGMTTRVPVPFAPQMAHRLDPEGYLWFGTTDRFRFVRTTLEGDTLMVVERPVEREPVTESELERAMAGLERFTAQGAQVDPRRIPSEKPAFGRLFLGDHGHLFVVPYTSRATTVDRLDVVDSAGRYLGELPMNPPLYPSPPPVIRGNWILGVTVDDAGVPFVVRYRIER